MLRGNTNWNLYKTFIAVYETKNMRQASEILGITRTAVSQNIKELSNQLGIKLFTAHSKGVEPTDEANSIYPKIKNAVESITIAENSVAKLNDENNKTVKIALSGVSTGTLIKGYLKEFYTKYPDIRLEISQLKDLDLIKQKQVDMIIGVKDIMNQNLKIINVYKTHPVFIVSKEFLKKHGLSNTISKEQLSKLPIIMLKDKDIVWKQENEVEESLSTILPVTAPDMTYSMVENSIGVGISSKEALKLLNATNNTDLVSLNVHDMPLNPVQFVCGYNGNLAKSARIFVDGLVESCKQQLSPGKIKKA